MSTLQVQVPEAYQIKEPLHQNTYLVNGQLKPWTGTTTKRIFFDFFNRIVPTYFIGKHSFYGGE